MDNATHFAALKAAAKVAFGITILAGCAAETATSEEGDQTASTESDYKKKAVTTTCHHDAGQAPKPTCDQVLASAFPDAGGFTWNWEKDGGAPKPSDDVKSCCEEALSKNFGSGPYRWACCDALDNGAGSSQNIGIACTPWGPPVPPRMRRRNVAIEGVV
jgi:hypothetical protein